MVIKITSSSPSGSPESFSGQRFFQKMEWLMWPPPLKRRAGNEVLRSIWDINELKLRMCLTGYCKMRYLRINWVLMTFCISVNYWDCASYKKSLGQTEIRWIWRKISMSWWLVSTFLDRNLDIKSKINSLMSHLERNNSCRL